MIKDIKIIRHCTWICQQEKNDEITEICKTKHSNVLKEALDYFNFGKSVGDSLPEFDKPIHSLITKCSSVFKQVFNSFPVILLKFFIKIDAYMFYTYRLCKIAAKLASRIC